MFKFTCLFFKYLTLKFVLKMKSLEEKIQI